MIDATSGAVLYSRNPERLFITASNMKLVVAAAAFARFGPDHRYRTDVLAGPLTGDSAGTLLVSAAGDPTWSARFHPTATTPLDSLAGAVARAGIRRVGGLVVDASRFSDELVHSAWEVGDLPFSYAPPVDAFALAEGTFRLVVTGARTAGQPGTTRVIGPVPQPIRAEVITDTTGARAALRVDHSARRDTVYVQARVGAGAADTSTLATTRPADAAARALADALARAGVHVADVAVLRDSAAAASARATAMQPVATWLSVPLRDIIAGILQPSQNWVAEQVLKTLGAEFGRDGSWRGGVAVERTFLMTDVALDSTSFNLRDASGLSAQNLLTPAATVALLVYARAQPWGALYRAALPVPGQPGTLSGRLLPLAGRVAAKTGTISNVNSLSGYLTTSDGRELIFSIYTNGSGQPSARVRQAIDDVVLAIAGGGR